MVYPYYTRRKGRIEGFSISGCHELHRFTLYTVYSATISQRVQAGDTERTRQYNEFVFTVIAKSIEEPN